MCSDFNDNIRYNIMFCEDNEFGGLLILQNKLKI